MRIVALSDTHGFHRGMKDLPEGDVLVFAGDWSRDYGSWVDVLRFARWMAKQPHAHKIVCPGNHDYAVYTHPSDATRLFGEHGLHLVGQKPLTVEGVTFDGGPWMPLMGRDPEWAFCTGEDSRRKFWASVPEADVLVTHVPPHGILDLSEQGQRLGCSVLRERVFEIRPRLHLFGHVHECRGTLEINGIAFANVSSNTRGKFTRKHTPDGFETTMTLGIREAMVFDL